MLRVRLHQYSAKSLGNVGEVNMHAVKLRQKPSKDAGFSVLEALIAMAVLAAALLPILELQGQMARTALSIERADANIAAQQNALGFLKTVNFQQHKTGELDIGNAVLRWSANPVHAEALTRHVNGDGGRYVMSLYTVDARLAFNDGHEYQFTVEGLGWEPQWPISSYF
jgi:general secretion pathway protein I